jgi:hypothetical protein
MKTKLEDFKDRSELFQWAADRKPINCMGDLYESDTHGRYIRNIQPWYMKFSLPLEEYKKVIEIETNIEVSVHNVFFCLNRNGDIYFSMHGCCISMQDKEIAKLKLTATIEKCKETGEIVSKEFKLEEVE